MPRRNYKKIKIGREVKSLKQWCERTGVDPRRARQRITDLGWSPAEAVGMKPRVIDREALAQAAFPDESISLTYNRKTLTITEWHEQTKIPLRTLYYRYRRGWDVADILDPERHNSRAKRMERAAEARKEAAKEKLREKLLKASGEDQDVEGK